MEKRSLKDILSSPKCWIKCSLARTKRGFDVMPGNEYAVKWCLVGAASELYGDDDKRFKNTLEKMAKVIEATSVWRDRVGFHNFNPQLKCVNFNNHRKTKSAEIQELIEKAKV